MKNIKRNILIGVYLIITELIFSLLIKGTLESLWLKCFFTLQISILIGVILIFKEKTNKILCGNFLIINSILYIIYFIYYKIFGNVLSIVSIFKIDQIALFKNQIVEIILSNWYVLVIFLLPVILYFIFFKKISIKKNTKKEIILLIIFFFIVYSITILIINLDKKEQMYSNKNLYYNIKNGTENLNKFGLLTTIRLDIQRTLTGFKEKQLYKYEDNNGNIKILDKEQYNMLDIDFETLIKNEDNEEIKEIHSYIKAQEPTKKNIYTGKFKDKNLIVIIAESFSSLAIREDITPTLYKLANTGYKFNNFYTPLFPISTADGEYLTDTSLLPAEGVWSMEEVEGKIFPYSYANVLKYEGYKTYSYHNYKYDYYKRDIYLKTMGYGRYLAQGNGLEKRMDFSKTPSSDCDMIKSTINDYINEEKFLAYYVTMSGHFEYNKNHSIVQKNWEKVKKLPYSEAAKAYLATQIELDKAVEEILNTLKNAGKLEETVIVISGDHYPYGLSESEIKELSPYETINYDYNIEKYHMPLIIYSAEETKNIEIDKFASSLDILPTVLNLFGIEYDSRLLMGKDIFSNSESLIIFSDRSFITDKGRYNKKVKKFIPIQGTQINDEYVKNIQQQIYFKYRISRLILENDYYRELQDFFKK